MSETGPKCDVTVVKQMNLFPVYILGMLLRAWLFSAEDGGSWLVDRVEISTPLNSYKRLTEGIVLLRLGVDPYSGVLFHETPILLHLFNWLEKNLYPRRINAIFILLDAVTALILGKLGKILVRNLLRDQAKNAKSYHEDAAELLIKADEIQKMERYAQLAYLFHPYVIANCVAKTTTVFSNLVLAGFLLSMMLRRKMIACLFLAFSTLQNFYPAMLIFPLCAYFCLGNTLTVKDAIVKEIVPTVSAFACCFGILNFVSYKLMGDSWSFLYSTHGFILTVPELTPNMGLFWYFFTEMFEHFRLFFVCTFQINCFVYVIPLTIRFKNEPYLLAFTLIGLTAIFKSYPCYGEVGFYTALLPTVAFHLVPYMKQTFIIANMFLATTFLGPILYQLWIFNGSANANYFFAITLVFGTAQIFLLTDILFAHVKREFYLYNGYKSLKPAKSGSQEESRLVLK